MEETPFESRFEAHRELHETLEKLLQASPHKSSLMWKNSLVLLSQSSSEFYQLTQQEMNQWPLLQNTPLVQPRMDNIFWAPSNDTKVSTNPVMIWQDLLMAETVGLMAAHVNSLKSYRAGICAKQYQSFYIHQELLKGRAKSLRGQMTQKNNTALFFVTKNQEKPYFTLRSFSSLSHLENSLDVVCYDLAAAHYEQMTPAQQKSVSLFLKGQTGTLRQLSEFAEALSLAYRF